MTQQKHSAQVAPESVACISVFQNNQCMFDFYSVEHYIFYI